MVNISIETAEKILSYFRVQYGEDVQNLPVLKTLIQAVKDAKEEDNARTKYMDQMEAENERTFLPPPAPGTTPTASKKS